MSNPAEDPAVLKKEAETLKKMQDLLGKLSSGKTAFKSAADKAEKSLSAEKDD
jgi:hypothetical protein